MPTTICCAVIDGCASAPFVLPLLLCRLLRSAYAAVTLQSLIRSLPLN